MLQRASEDGLQLKLLQQIQVTELNWVQWLIIVKVEVKCQAECFH